MLKEIYKETETRMKGAIQALEEDLSGIRTGRASPALFERLHVEYYGTPTALIQLASISVPEPRSLLIKPFDASSPLPRTYEYKTSFWGSPAPLKFG